MYLHFQTQMCLKSSWKFWSPAISAVILNTERNLEFFVVLLYQSEVLSCSKEPLTHGPLGNRLVQVRAWCRQATSHYLNQCWTRSLCHMASLGRNELNKCTNMQSMHCILKSTHVNFRLPVCVILILLCIFLKSCFSSCSSLVHALAGCLRKLRGTIVNIILPPRVSFYRREIYFAAASFILLPRVLFYCRELYFTAASFMLAPRVLYYCREFYYTAARFILPPRVLFSPPRVLFSPLAVK